jgi:amidohydrolase
MVKLFCILNLIPFIIFSQDINFLNYFKAKANDYFQESVQIRRHLHQCPETCYHEKETSEFIAKYLTKLGLEVHKGIGKYGIKAVLKGNTSTPVIGIRADMDALPIEEKINLPFSSKNKGTMHACGHDAHMTNVLMAARLLSEVKDQLPGTVVFIFQPCEEGPPPGELTGADRMIKEGVLENPKIEAMLGLHVFPDLPIGTIGIRKGPIMANVASCYIKIFGKSSHGAYPHKGIDAIYAASSAVMQFQSLISRFRDPNEPAVLTIGKINGGVRLNVVADRVEMEGTIRTFSFELQDKIEKGMEKILKGLSYAYGIKYRFDFEKSAPYVKNDNQLTEFLTPIFREVLGDHNVLNVDPQTIAEDFAYYSHKIPSTFFFLGVGNHKDLKLHSPNFAVDEDTLKIAPVLFAYAAVTYIKKFRGSSK